MRQSGVVKSGAFDELIECMGRKGLASYGCQPWMTITRNVFQEESGKIPLSIFTALIENAANESGDTALGLELGKEFRSVALGPLGRLLPKAQTFGDALDGFARYFSTLQTDTKVKLTINNENARISYMILDPSVRFRAQDAAFTLSFENILFSNLLDFSWKPSWVEFEYDGNVGLADYQKHFGCPIRFSQRENAFVFPAKFLSLPLKSADEISYSKIRNDLENTIVFECDRLNFVQSVEAWVAASIYNAESTNIEFVAHDFGMSLRSFHRKLIEFDIGYLDIKNQIRLKIAKNMLKETDLSITDIAMFLGYSEASAFVRHFKKNVGIPPRKFRFLI